ncbi:MAG: hypothetical protein QOH90_2207 [Actinomycetota bacterium]|nr:hypothetical protein [Actinomycetota bacterium]
MRRMAKRTKQSTSSIDLYWLPLGAGGHFVRFNGLLYEYIQAHKGRRPRCELYHTALEVQVPDGRFIIEDAWPIPDRHPEMRGVTVEGPVWTPWLARFRAFRYEVRRWRDGTIADLGQAVESPQRLSADEGQAIQLLKLAASVPRHIWGRDEMHVGDMWNSNSVVSWLLTRVGIPAIDLVPPIGGRAPGWNAGVIAAQRDYLVPRPGPS